MPPKTCKIICGDMLKILPTLPRAQMIFADPPDNIGLKYANGESDKVDPDEYRARLCRWIDLCQQTATND